MNLSPNAEARPNVKGRIAGSLRHMVDEADQLIKSAGAAGDEKFEEVRGRIEQQLRDLRTQLDELEESALDRARQAARQADEAVHLHPYSAMGIAAAIGLLIGVLIPRR